MMGKKDRQIRIAIVDMDALIPENHLLKKLDNYVDFDFICEKIAPYYSKIDRPSIDPVCMVKMLLVGTLS